jgi:hypothetical protein
MAHFGDGPGFEIRPEPTAHEREAIVHALAAAGLLDLAAQPRAWWLEGLREGLVNETDPPDGHWKT